MPLLLLFFVLMVSSSAADTTHIDSTVLNLSDSTPVIANDTLLSPDKDTLSLTDSIAALPDSNSTLIPDTLSDSIHKKTIPTAAPVVQNQPHHTQTDTLDSLAIIKREELLKKEGLRRSIHYPDLHPLLWDSLQIERSLFSTDATSWYDVPYLKRRTVNIRTGVASTFNRFLLYGNTAPLNKSYYGSKLLYRKIITPISGEDAVFTNEFRGLSLIGSQSLHYLPHHYGLVSPEVSILWETGVFDENILSLRFSRPISRRVMINAYSNYRHFDGTDFSHNGNDIYHFYSSVTPDTTLLSHYGYNPLTNEYYCGADATYLGKYSTSYFRINYGDLSNELVINREQRDQELDFSRFSQYPLSLFLSVTSHLQSPFFITGEGNYSSTPVRWTRSVKEVDSITQETSYSPQSVKIDYNDISAALRGGVKLGGKDSISLQFNGNRNKIKANDSISMTTQLFRPEVLWNRPFSLFILHGYTMAGAGYDIHVQDSSIEHSFFAHALLQASLNNYRFHFSIEKDNLHYVPLPESLSSKSIIHDSYIRTGIEVQKEWQFFDLLIGYQWCSAVDTIGLQRAWFSGTYPYKQPQSVFIISPEIGPWKGLTFSSRLMLSDTKPHVKLQGALSLHAFPKLTHEAFDVRLGFDYWSGRDSIYFADLSDWNRPILDINFSTSVHIKSFRLIYKVDNLLNRNFAYVPGYYAPGITFRWGFAWFIQR